MLDDSLRRLMRNIALGLPLMIGAPLGGCVGVGGGGGGGGCETPTFTLYRDQLAAVDAGLTGDAGWVHDAGWAADAGDGSADADMPDAGMPDAAIDAATPDADMPDAATPDSGMPDAAIDAATPDADMPDAATPDAGMPDAAIDAAPPDADVPDAATPDAGSLGDDAGSPESPLTADCLTLCRNNAGFAPFGGSGITSCTDVDENEIHCVGEQVCQPAGRQPLTPFQGSIRGQASRFFEELAVAELASAPAFTQLAQALRAHGAPEALVQRALDSADDEVRHAEMAAHLGGLDAVSVRVDESPMPSLRELALHNAAEGCVAEAYAALEAAFMAQHAERPDVRRAFAEIAQDEARHAMLSLDIDRWVRGQLDASEHPALDAARTEAMTSLRARLSGREPVARLGLPEGDEREALFAQLAA